MPEYDENGEEIEESEGMSGLRNAKKAAEKRAQEAEEALASAAADRRELAALKADLNPQDKATAFFLKHYDGEPTAEAMKAAAIDAGVIPEVDQAAAESVQGQAQMARAFQGGESAPIGAVAVGEGMARHQVPAEEAEMWQAFEAKVKAGDMQGGAEVLRTFGRDLSGIEDIEMAQGAGGPQTQPLSGRPF